MKKRGFGQGRWNGVGGKPEADESIAQTAIRECQEEIGVTPIAFRQVAQLDFAFPAKRRDWDQRVAVYLCTEWQGEPTESEEMRPQWYSIGEIPYDTMWHDDQYWLPSVLDGAYVRARFEFDDNDRVSKHEVLAEPLI